MSFFASGTSGGWGGNGAGDGRAALRGSSGGRWSGSESCEHTQAHIDTLAHPWLKICIKIPTEGCKSLLNRCWRHPCAGGARSPSHPHRTRPQPAWRGSPPRSVLSVHHPARKGGQTDRRHHGGEMPPSGAGSWGQPGARGGLEVPPHARQPCSPRAAQGSQPDIRALEKPLELLSLHLHSPELMGISAACTIPLPVVAVGR